MSETEARLVIVGELHGTEQGPRLIGNMVCHALASGKSVAVGLELPGDDGRLDAYLESPGGPSDIDAFTRDSRWRAEQQDGRRSRAKFDLIETLRAFRAEGHRLSVFGFVSNFDASPYLNADRNALADQDGYAEAHEANMARNIVSGLQDADLTIVLVGSVHGCEGRMERDGRDYRLMSDFIDVPGTVRLLTTYATGTAWNCRGGVCGPSTAEGQDATEAAPFMIDLTRQPEFICDYDGAVTLGPISASEPFASADVP